MKKIYGMILLWMLPVLDFMVISASGLLSYAVYRILEIGQQAVYPLEKILTLCALSGVASVFILFLFDAYEKESGILNVEEIRKTIKGITASFICFAVITLLVKFSFPRYVLVFSYLISMFFLTLEKTVCYRLLHLSKNIPGMGKRIIIYGAGELGQDLFRAIANSPKRGIHPIGFVDDDPGLIGTSFRSSSFHNSSFTISVLGTGEDLPRLVESHEINEVCVAISNAGNERLIAILDRWKKQNFSISFVPNLYTMFYHDMKIETVGQIPIVREAQINGSRFYQVSKKAMDLVGAASLLVILSPLLLWISLTIKKDSEGPVLFRHQRVGLNGKKFELMKFRTMKQDTEAYAVNPLRFDDDRVTRFGRFLRKTSLDELPQLWNVLKGDMSLVGPRPEMPFIVNSYTERQRRRLAVKPGITGLWQLSGDRESPIHHNMDYDLYYIKHNSFFLDVAILIETVFFAFQGI